MGVRVLARLGPGIVLALGLSVATDLALAQSQQHSRRTQQSYADQDQQDQSYLDPGPAPSRTRVPNYVAIGQSNFSQPFYDSMADPGGSDFEDMTLPN
jgi:hypothetical protein